METVPVEKVDRPEREREREKETRWRGNEISGAFGIAIS
jgi:hypothetical protein